MGPVEQRRWNVRTSAEVREWLRELRKDDPDSYRSVNVSIDMLAETGPALGRPLVDTLKGSFLANLKELRPRSGRDVAIRILFVFDPWSQAVLLVAGNKAGNWDGWYKQAIPKVETGYQAWLEFEQNRRQAL
ncbi:type II toxin-antitoxin system RelE/ParE family toxin [Catellatospora methionotrophica]|uniref:type II toxin-antitoxin system RelE/ParE family toxin n=1 Tax=Catellatospora methionotrophica TaxID=121620 RepID=UPI0033F96DB8